ANLYRTFSCRTSARIIRRSCLQESTDYGESTGAPRRLCVLRERAHNFRMNGHALAEQICATLRQAGHQAYLVGGCVRDLILGREPADYDVCTDARPERVQELFPDSLAIGARFGVILVVREGAQVEVATFRSDVGYSDGRHPDRVNYADSPQEDVR